MPLDSNGIWQYAETDEVSPWSDYMNLGQESISEAFDAFRADYPTAAPSVTKLTCSANWSLGNAGVESHIVFSAAPILIPGSWSLASPRFLYLPYIGNWKISGAASGTSMDTDLLRSWIRLNGASKILDSQHSVMGTSGVTDPFIRPSTVITTTNSTSYVEFGVSSNTGSPNALLASSIALIAEFLG